MKLQALLIGSLLVAGVISLERWMTELSTPDSPEAGTSSEGGSKSDNEERLVQGAAAYLEKNPEHLPKLQDPSSNSHNSQGPIQFMNINLSDSQVFVPENREALQLQIMKSCQDNPTEFLNLLSNQLNAFPPGRSEERERLLEVVKLSSPYLPTDEVKAVFLGQADKYRAVPGSDDFTFGAKALQAYFDLEPDLEKRNQALNRIGQVQPEPSLN